MCKCVDDEIVLMMGGKFLALKQVRVKVIG